MRSFQSFCVSSSFLFLTCFTNLISLYRFGIFWCQEPDQWQFANILWRQSLDYHPKKEDQHGIQYPSVGCISKNNRKVQRHDKGQQSVPYAEQHDLQQDTENDRRAVWYKNAPYLSHCPAFGSNHHSAIQRSADWNRQQTVRTYRHKNNPKLLAEIFPSKVEK